MSNGDSLVAPLVFRIQIMYFVSQVSHCWHLSSSSIFVPPSCYHIHDCCAGYFQRSPELSSYVPLFCAKPATERTLFFHRPRAFRGQSQGDAPIPSMYNDKRHWSTLSPPSEDGTRRSPTILDPPHVDTTTVANLENE